MSSLPKVLDAEAGTIELVSSVRLPNGKVVRDAVKMNASSLLPCAEQLEEWHSKRMSTETYTIGEDVIRFRSGGTDWLPKVIFFNQGPNGGSMSMPYDSIPELVQAMRRFAERKARRS